MAVGRTQTVYDWDVGGYREDSQDLGERENLEPLTLTSLQTSEKTKKSQSVMFPPGLVSFGATLEIRARGVARRRGLPGTLHLYPKSSTGLDISLMRFGTTFCSAKTLASVKATMR